MSRFFSLLFGLSTALACSSTSQPSTSGVLVPGTIQVASGQSFDLIPGGTARVAGSQLRIHFASVTQDSRCPSDVQCVWAGDAVIRLILSSADVSTRADLHTGIDPRIVTFGGYRIRAVSLKPVPVSTKPVPAKDYVVSLEILGG